MGVRMPPSPGGALCACPGQHPVAGAGKPARLLGRV